MAAVTLDNATRLYEILDGEVGVFRQEDMPAGAVQFHEKKKADFIDQFTSEIPELYWFQGVEAHSVNLLFDSRGFRLEAVGEHSERVANIIESANAEIEAANIRIVDHL